ncbi:hypothetical protein DRQ36_08950 [bacterium]|nr:MAG: hypothetical protein DRQ36_08950 [bacterium]
MFWTKNKEGKKAGTTVIGICYNGKAALGTDFDAEKADGDEVGIVKIRSETLIGFTGKKSCCRVVDDFGECIDSCADLPEAAQKICRKWESELQNAEADGELIAINRKTAYMIAPGKAEHIESGIIAIGPGKDYALAAIRAVVSQPEVTETAPEIVKKAFKVASGVCVLVNPEATIISLD